MSDEINKNCTKGSVSKRYTIPRKQRLSSEDCQQGIPLDSREAKEIINTIHHLTWDSAEEFSRNFVISRICKVDNQVLEREFQTKRTELRDNGRSVKELSEHYAFKAEYYSSQVKEQCKKGLYCNGSNNILGDGKMGVSVWRCPDLCVKSLVWPDTGTIFLIVFRIVKGRVKPVSPKQANQETILEPTPNYDCHVSKNVQHSSTADIATLMTKTQYYLYEYDEDGLPRDRPRHCLPFAVIHLNKPMTKQPAIEEIPVHVATEVIPSTIFQETKVQYLTENDGRLAWRGLIGSKESSLGVVAIMAGHKLGLTLWKSFIDVRSKLPLDNLLKVIPGDIRTAWNKPLRYRGHIFSLCILKPCGPTDKFISFVKSLAMKDHSAGVVIVDSYSVMFLVPSCKLSVELGFCEDEEPWRMFCILRRRLKYSSSNIATKSSLNPEAFQPSLIEPEGLNINLKLEVPNQTQDVTGNGELTGIKPLRQKLESINRSKLGDCTNISAPRNTLTRRVSEVGYSYNSKSPLLPSPSEPTRQEPLRPPPQEQEKQPLSAQAPQQDMIQSSDDSNKEDSFNKVCFFQSDRIPFLEYANSSPVVDEDTNKTNTMLSVDKKDRGCHMTGGNHSDDRHDSDVIKPPDHNDMMNPDDQGDPSSLSRVIQRDGNANKQNIRKDDQYYKHLQTLVPCTKHNENTKQTYPKVLSSTSDKISTVGVEPGSHLIPCSIQDTERSANRDMKNDDKPLSPEMSRDLLSSRDVSPRSSESYIRHKQTLKRKASLIEREAINNKKKKMDFGNENDNIDSIRDPVNVEKCIGVSRDNELKWSRDLQVVELMLIEKGFQVIEENIEALEKENAFEILNIDSVTEISEGQVKNQILPDICAKTGINGNDMHQMCILEHKASSRTPEQRIPYVKHGGEKGSERLQDKTKLSGKDNESEVEAKVLLTRTMVQKTDDNPPGLTASECCANVIHTSTITSHTSTITTLTSTCQSSTNISQNSTNTSQTNTNTSHISTITGHISTSTCQTSTNTSQTSTKKSHNGTNINRTTCSTNTSLDLTINNVNLCESSSTCVDENQGKTKTSVAQIDIKASTLRASGPVKSVSNSLNRSIPYCYSGSSHLLYDPPPLKARRLVNDNPRINPTRFQYIPSPRINNTNPFLPTPNQRFCRLPSLYFNGPWRMPFFRPPLPLVPNGFPYRPSWPSISHYKCYGDSTNRIL